MKNETQLPKIKDYFSLREFLQDYYQVRKQKHPWFSYRFWAGELELDSGYLLKVIQGKKRLPKKYLKALVKFLDLDAQDKLYLEQLLRFESAKLAEDTQVEFAKLLQLKNIDFITLKTDHYLYFSKWYIVAIRSLIEVLPLKDNFADYSSALSPSIPVEEVKRGVQILERLGLIVKNDQGYFELANTLLTTGDDWHHQAIRFFQKSILTLGLESLDRHSAHLRDISTLTFTLPQNKLNELKEMIKYFRQDVLKWVRENRGEDSVYQLNFQLFPVALTDPSKDKQDD